MSIFEFKLYKDYLLSKTGDKHSRRGEKMAIAKSIGCQPTFISHILYKNAHLSLEQGEKLNRYFQHNKEESAFFLLLIQKDRAGTKSLEKFFQEQLDVILEKRLILTERLGTKNTLSLTEQATYYSSWQYAAVHVALSVPKLQNKNNLSRFLNISPKRIIEILDFLLKVGLAEEKNGHFISGRIETRLGKDSPNIIKHHSNWRNQAIESLEREEILDLHYSSVVSIDKVAAAKIKNILMESIKNYVSCVKHANEEEVYCLNMDLFLLNKQVE